jgi:beta-glucosidase
VIDSAEHRQLARRAAQQSLVLLKNDGVLPLRSDLKAVAVIGPNANAPLTLWGNYSGIASQTVTPLDGIRQRLPGGAKLYYAEGCKIQGTELFNCAPHGNLTEAVLLAERADVSVLVLGLNAQIEGEQGDAGNTGAATAAVGSRRRGRQAGGGRAFGGQRAGRQFCRTAGGGGGASLVPR